ILTCFFNGLTGLCMMLHVTQTPTDLFLVSGATMNLTCSHNDKSYDKIYWYQQSNGQNLEHLGFLSFKQPLVDREGFTITGDISTVTSEDSAMYFCAVSDTV
uniref:Ig-like domain-containing protein n=1 Tax=Cyprinus carpio TaxID=7962 RepID=A0A8C1Z4C4_CYPCA